MSAPVSRRSDWLLLTTANVFKFTLVGFYLVAVMTMLKTYGYTLDQLSWVYLLSAAEAAKVLFSTLVEKFRFPGIGRFRFWLLLSCTGIVLSLCGLAAADPRRDFAWLLPLCFMLSVFGVIFGCAVLGLGCTVLPYRERGFGGVIQVVAARSGKMLGGALVLWIYRYYGWTNAVAAVLAFSLLVWLQTALYKEPPSTSVPLPPKSGFHALFKRMIWFWKETSCGLRWFALLLLSCVPYAFNAVTFVPKLNDMGWQPQHIGLALSVVIPAACMLAAPAAGILARHVRRSRLVSVLLAVQIPLSASLYAIDTFAAVHAWLPVVQIALVNIGYTLLLPVVMALMMDKARPDYAALDCSLQLSVMLAGTYAAGFFSLRLASAAGYPAVYLTAAAIGAFLWLAVRLWRDILEQPEDRQIYRPPPDYT